MLGEHAVEEVEVHVDECGSIDRYPARRWPTAVSGKRILLTGGAGFLGARVRERLEAAGAADIFIPRRVEYDLTDAAEVARVFGAAKPDTVVHLAAEVGGIGANRDNPGRYFYANMAMGLHLIEEARRRGTEKFVQVGTVCSYPKFTPVPFQRGGALERLPRGDERALRRRQEGAARDAPGLPRAVRDGRRVPDAGEPLRPGRQLRPRVEPRDPGADPQVRGGARRGRRARSSAGARAAHRASSSTSTTAPTRSSPPRCATTTPSRSTSAPTSEITIKDLTELIARLTGFEGELVWDPTKPDGQPRRCLDTSRAKELLGFEARTTLEEGLERTIAWYRAEGPGAGAEAAASTA